ncbi:MAG: hypothetical protein ACK5LK_00495 [Chthoniobacterales bacterium]
MKMPQEGANLKRMALWGLLIFSIGVFLAFWNRARILKDQSTRGQSQVLSLEDPPDELYISIISIEKNPVGQVLWIDGWGDFQAVEEK